MRHALRATLPHYYEARMPDRLSTGDFAETTDRSTLRGTLYNGSRSPPSDTLLNLPRPASNGAFGLYWLTTN